jgi:short-subunit dehydrogenase
MSIEQKVVITGASQGIGAGSVRGYRDRNYRVIASFRSFKAGSDADILAVPSDISKPETAERIAVLANVGAAATGVMSLCPVSRGANSTCINPG